LEEIAGAIICNSTTIPKKLSSTPVRIIFARLGYVGRGSCDESMWWVPPSKVKKAVATSIESRQAVKKSFTLPFESIAEVKILDNPMIIMAPTASRERSAVRLKPNINEKPI
jgi:hypothetical protein